MRPLTPLRRFRSFVRDRKGVAAVEFALLLPVMMLGYVGAVELSNAMMAQRRVSHSASALGDLVAQYPSIQKSDTADIFNAAALIMAPFDNSTVSLRMTEFTYVSSGKMTVTWTEPYGPSVWTETYTKGGTIAPATPRDTQVMTLLNQAVAAGQSKPSIVLSEAQYTYDSPLHDVLATVALPNAMTFNDGFYLSPRSGATITCTDC